MTQSVRIRLMIMMFLQFFCWGAWYGQMSKYMFTQLNATGDQVGNAYTAFSIAMIISPFFIGMIADRFFSAQKVLGVLNLLGAVILFFLSKVTDASSFFWLIFAYCLTFAPTISLTSSIAMRQMTASNKDFPAIRVMGTVAWIVVTNIIGFYALGDKVAIFQIAMISALVVGVFSFFLPDTPPTSNKNVSFSQIIGVDAFRLLKNRSFLIFFISSILICIPLSFYYAMANPSLTDAGMANVENKMSLGQFSEVFFMLLIPFFFRKYGVKWILVAGLIAWIIRFVCFGYGNVESAEWMLYLAILLHGICYDFFFVSGMIYTDLKAGETIKSQAQGLITLATYGIGMGIGSKLAGIVTDIYTVNEVKNWTSIWMVPAYISVAVLLLFFIFFRDNEKTTTQ